jgi:hypothetical protein
MLVLMRSHLLKQALGETELCPHHGLACRILFLMPEADTVPNITESSTSNECIMAAVLWASTGTRWSRLTASKK